MQDASVLRYRYAVPTGLVVCSMLLPVYRYVVPTGLVVCSTRLPVVTDMLSLRDLRDARFFGSSLSRCRPYGTFDYFLSCDMTMLQDEDEHIEPVKPKLSPDGLIRTFLYFRIDGKHNQRTTLLLDSYSDFFTAFSGDVSFFGFVFCDSILHFSVQKKIGDVEFEAVVSGEIRKGNCTYYKRILQAFL